MTSGIPLLFIGKTNHTTHLILILFLIRYELDNLDSLKTIKKKSCKTVWLYMFWEQPVSPSPFNSHSHTDIKTDRLKLITLSNREYNIDNKNMPMLVWSAVERVQLSEEVVNRCGAATHLLENINNFVNCQAYSMEAITEYFLGHKSSNTFCVTPMMLADCVAIESLDYNTKLDVTWLVAREIFSDKLFFLVAWTNGMVFHFYSIFYIYLWSYTVCKLLICIIMFKY